MTIVKINSESEKTSPKKFALFQLGFRPFFVLAGFSAIILISVWIVLLASKSGFNNYYGLVAWHSHEMLFGFIVAVIAGFLLTSVQNWTGLPTLKGVGLIALVGLWLLARIFALLPEIFPLWLIALSDLSFIPVLAIVLTIPIIKSNKKPQLIFVAILCAMFFANILVHLQLLGVTTSTFDLGITLMINSVLLIIVIMTGRVVPFFIERGAPGAKPVTWPLIEKLSFGVMIAILIVELISPIPWFLTSLFCFAFIVHTVRLYGWSSKVVLSVPLLWVLYCGYLWLILGFILKAFAIMDIGIEVMAVHALAAAMSVLSLGMMSRVSLGHTGRALKTAKVISWAFILLNMAMLIRVFGPILLPEMFGLVVVFSGALWSLVFVIFLYIYVPILIRARVDGQPG